jgi:hypothetical protein
MSRIVLATAAAAAAIAIGAIVVTTGSAQAPTATTLHLVSTTQKNVGFGPHHAPRQGDRFGFGDKITGTATGYDRGVCTFIGQSKALCNVVVNLSNGTLTGEGLLAEKSKNRPFTITGGTGAYDGARGTALITDVNSKTTKIDVTLLP